MPYCPYCGVEVDMETRKCPLCETDIPKVPEGMKVSREYPLQEHELKYLRRPFTLKERKAVLWLVSLILLIPFTVVLVVDLYLNHSVTWSMIAVLALGEIWLIIAVALFQRKFWNIFLSFFLIIVLLSFLIACFAGALEEYLQWNLPITMIAALSALGCSIYGRRTREKGLNILGAGFWGVAVFCIGLDLLIGFNLQREHLLHGWSLIVSSALLPLGALMMYLHYRFGKTFPLKRYFHV